MSIQDEIKKLIESRNNGDLKAQEKIDLLFEEHRKETSSERGLMCDRLKKANANVYSN